MVQKSVCIVVVTYNRKELLVRNIRSALSQSYPVNILIFDNHSTDGTKEKLKKEGFFRMDNIFYYYSDKNLGGAGGFSDGMKMAYEMGYDLIWLMDDDGYCYNSETLSCLIKKIPHDCEEYILNSTVICNDERLLTFGFIEITTYAQLEKVSVAGVYDGYINPFNGTLISRGCIEKLGFPKGEFFIYGDEHEYMLRALKNNVLIRTVLDSLYFHPINRTIQYQKVWKYDVPIKDEPVWKTFCDVRNSIYIARNYTSFKILLIKMFTLLSAACLKKEKRKVFLKYTIIGIFDGLTENFNRPIMFNE